MSEVKKVSERHPRSMQSSTMDTIMSVRIMKMLERSDLPASTGQEKTWLRQRPFATAVSAAFGHSSDHGTVQQQHLNAHHQKQLVGENSAGVLQCGLKVTRRNLPEASP